MISLKNISYTLSSNEKILDNINLNIKKGEFVVITGKSGSGKSTLGSVINGFISHYNEGILTGEAYINGENISGLELSQIGKKVGSVFQDPRSQFFMLDPYNEIAFGCCNMSLDIDEIKERIEKSLKALDIERLKEKSIFQLSSGEKQKLAIASCYAMEPEIYLFDEPTANLDIKSIFDLRDILRTLKNAGKTVVVLEHRLFYLSQLLDRIIVISEGKIVAKYSNNHLQDIQVKHSDIRNLFLKDLNIKNHNKPNLDKKEIFEVEKLSYSNSKSDKDYLLKDISFKAYGNEIIGIVGRNGVGKTTFARICAGLLQEQNGEIRIEGQKYKYKKRLGNIYFVMQDSDFQLFSNSVKGELCIGKTDSCFSEYDIDNILSQFEILEFKERHPMTLSRGQKQRLTIATALTSNSKIIFLDEPTSGLDKNSMDLVTKSLLKMAKEDKVLFVVSHDYEFLLSVCNRIIHFENGIVKDDFRLDNDTKHRLWDILSKEG